MKVYLLPVAGDRWVFYAETSRPCDEPGAEPPKRGLRGWLVRKYQACQALLDDAELATRPRLQRAWRRLQRFVGPDESLLIRLRQVAAVDLHHPASMAEAEAGELWHRYLGSRTRYHRLWFVVHTLLSPVTMVLTIPLPGPNFIGYWFAYRCACHALAMWGAGRARAGRIATRCHPSPVLDPPETGPGAEAAWLARTADHFGLRGLRTFLDHEASRRGPRPGPPPTRGSGAGLKRCLRESRPDANAQL